MRIELHVHPFSAEPPQVFEAENLAEWLLAHYGERPMVTVQIYAGAPSRDTDISADADAIIRSDEPLYTILESPGAQFVPMIIMMVISTAIQMILAKPVPISNRSQDSPNNQLSERQNQVRTLQRVEDIYGMVKSIPSLMMSTYKKYVQNQEVEYGYYCVGRGYHDITDVKDGDTLLSEINGASAAVYAPFTSPNSGSPQLQIGDPIIDAIVTVRPSSSVGGIVLKAANQLQLASGAKYHFCGPGPGGIVGGEEAIPAAPSNDVLLQPNEYRKPNIAAVAQVGQTLTISMSDASTTRTAGGPVTVNGSLKMYTANDAGFFRGVVVGSTVVIDGFADPTNNGAKTVVAIGGTSGNTLQVSEPCVDDETLVTGTTYAVKVNYSGTRTISSIASGYAILSGAAQWSPADYPLGGNVGNLGVVANVTIANGLVDWTDWFTLPVTDRTEVWTNVTAPAGMYKDDGAKQDATVAYEIQIEKLDALLNPTGVVETITGSVSGATSSLRAETLEHVTSWTGPARVRARRTTPFDYDFGGFVQDDISWQDLYSVSPVTMPHFGNKTTIHTITVANQNSTAQSTRELNCIAYRKLPIYDGVSAFSGGFNSDGELAWGSISATNRIIDILAAVTVDPKIGNRPITDLDLDQINAVQGALFAWNTSCMRFSYTFDSDQTSFEDTVTTIANAAFCIPYRQNGKIRLSADMPQASPVALFTHRNKKPKSETITRKFAADSDYDGVELVYQDPDTLSSETIRLPLDGSYTKLKKIEIPGIRDYTQAWFRANREYNRLISQRLTIETDTTTDARAILPNSRVDIVDNTRFKSFDGEVVAQSGLKLTLSRDVEFTIGATHSIILMKRDGSLQSISCTAGPYANQVVLGATPAEAIVTQQTPDGGIRTIFSFAADTARGAEAWLVQSIGISDGQYIKLQAINYSDDYYAADSQPVPDKSGVIYG